MACSCTTQRAQHLGLPEVAALQSHIQTVRQQSDADILSAEQEQQLRAQQFLANQREGFGMAQEQYIAQARQSIHAEQAEFQQQLMARVNTIVQSRDQTIQFCQQQTRNSAEIVAANQQMEGQMSQQLQALQAKNAQMQQQVATTEREQSRPPRRPTLPVQGCGQEGGVAAAEACLGLPAFEAGILQFCHRAVSQGWRWSAYIVCFITITSYE